MDALQRNLTTTYLTLTVRSWNRVLNNSVDHKSYISWALYRSTMIDHLDHRSSMTAFTGNLFKKIFRKFVCISQFPIILVASVFLRLPCAIWTKAIKRRTQTQNPEMSSTDGDGLYHPKQPRGKFLKIMGILLQSEFTKHFSTPWGVNWIFIGRTMFNWSCPWFRSCDTLTLDATGCGYSSLRILFRERGWAGSSFHQRTNRKRWPFHNDQRKRLFCECDTKNVQCEQHA